MNFIGAECLVCKKKFTEDDDIVVCEVCGTPYHRECYNSVHKCINTEYHTNGWTFNQKQRELAEVTETTQDTDNNLEDDFLDNNKSMEETYNQVINSSNEILRQSELNPNEEYSGVTLLEFYLYTKSLRNTKKFYKSENNEKTYSLLAFLFPEYYMFSKSMYVPAIFTTLINFCLSIPCTMMVFQSDMEEYEMLSNLVFSTGFKVLAIVCITISLLFRVFLSNKCLVMNFKQCINSINTIRKNTKLKKKSYNSFLKTLINVRSGINFFAMMMYGICSNILYSNFYLILDLMLVYLQSQ